MVRISNRQIAWYVINIKARRNQTPAHYVDVWKAINEQDPLVMLPRTVNRYASIRTMSYSPLKDAIGIHHYISTRLVAYTLIDPDRFYNRRTKEDMSLIWDKDVTANKKESDLIFIPSVHTLVVRKNSEITINHILVYLQEALNHIEPEGFDVNIVKDHETLEQILLAHALISINAHISYSNHGHSEGFQELFENKLKNAEPDSFDITLKGSRSHPLICEDDGIIKSIINLSEFNGSVKAVIQREINMGIENIDTEDHPRFLMISQNTDDINETLYNELRTLFFNENTNE